MKKTLLVIALLAVGGSSAFAQGLSTRENEAIVAKLGARPVAGDAALNFVIPLVGLNGNDGTEAGLFNGNLLTPGDLLTFKWYHTDNLVIRAGIRLYADNDRISGDVLDEEGFSEIPEGGVSTNKVINQNREYTIALGAEHHFTNSNIFDVYTGADLLVGLNKERSTVETEYLNIDGTLQDVTTRDLLTSQTNSTVIGLAWVVGWNTFVAQLPISVGIEYGLSMKWLLGGKTKVTEERDITNANSLESYAVEYYQDDALPGNIYSDMSKRQFNMDTNQNVRLTLNFYFTR
jgi:hypothetical protein